MRRSKEIYIIGFIIINILIMIWIIIHNEFDPDKILKYGKEIAVLEFSSISIYLAFRLYDQFGLNKKLTEKRVELIIELLTELKRQKGFGTHYEIKDKIWSNPAFYFEKNMVRKAIDYYSNYESLKGVLDSKFTMDLNDFDNGFQKVKEVLNNPIMPKSIIDKAQFLETGGGTGGKIVTDENEMTYLYFTQEGKNKLIKKDTQHWCFSYNNNCKLIEFLQKFDDLFEACEKWTNNHSNIDEGLNLKNF